MPINFTTVFIVTTHFATSITIITIITIVTITITLMTILFPHPKAKPSSATA